MHKSTVKVHMKGEKKKKKTVGLEYFRTEK